MHPQELIPDVLWIEVSQHLVTSDKMALSSSHSYLRDLISPIIFNPPNRPIQVRKLCWNCFLKKPHNSNHCRNTDIFTNLASATLKRVRSIYLNGTEYDHSRIFGSSDFQNVKSIVLLRSLSEDQIALFLQFVKQLDMITIDIPITDIIEMGASPIVFPIRSLNRLHRFQLDGVYLPDLPVAFGLGCSLTIVSFVSKRDLEVEQQYLTDCQSLLTYFSHSNFFPSLRVVGFTIPRPSPPGFPSPPPDNLEVRSKLFLAAWCASLAHIKSGGHGWRLRAEEPTSVRRLLDWDSFWGCWCGQPSDHDIVLTSDEINKFEKWWSKHVGVADQQLHARAALTNFLAGRIHIDATTSTNSLEGVLAHGMIVPTDFAGVYPTVRCLTVVPAGRDGFADLAWQFPGVTTLRLTEDIPNVPQLLVDCTALKTLHISASQLGPPVLDQCGHLKSYELAFLRDCVALKRLNVKGFSGCDQCDWRSLVMGLNRWLPVQIEEVDICGILNFGEARMDQDLPPKEWDMAWSEYETTVNRLFIDLVGKSWIGYIGVGGLWVRPRSYQEAQ